MKNIAQAPLIGADIEVIEAKNQANIGIKGKIINETRNTLEIRTTKGKKTLLKKNITLKINGLKVRGESLFGRPEERIKKR